MYGAHVKKVGEEGSQSGIGNCFVGFSKRLLASELFLQGETASKRVKFSVVNLEVRGSLGARSK